MKVLVGCLYHESNTFNPFPTQLEDFVIVEGKEVLERVCSTNIFIEAGITVIPTIYATALPSGIVSKYAYRYFADKILNVIKREKDLDGIWLHLHGAMTVEGIGSAELQLLKEIRRLVGFQIPISLTLDIHGNIAPDLCKYANIIRSYRTVPHTDQCETEIITAKLLIEAMRRQERLFPAFRQIPMMISGEKALGHYEPLKTIFKKLEEIEDIPGIATASFFIGFAWADVEYSSASVLVVPKTKNDYKIAKKEAKKLADWIYSKREEFKFAAHVLPADEAIDQAIHHKESPVFISDSGDNTTGGAVGINTELLNLFLKQEFFRSKKICIASIFDPKAYKECQIYETGDQVSVHVGVNFDRNSRSVLLEGIIKAKGDLLGYLGGTSDIVGKTCTIRSGNIDVVIANRGNSFITIDHFTASGLNIHDYDIIVVKQGYLFPELSEISKLDILALTKGATYQLIEDLTYDEIKRPIYPLDQ